MQVISKIRNIQSKTFCSLVHTHLRNTPGKFLCSVIYTSGDMTMFVLLIYFIVNVSCKHLCHVVKGLIHFGIATETPKGTIKKKFSH